MQEDPPGTEVAALNHPTQFLDALNTGELDGRRRMLQALEQFVVRVPGCGSHRVGVKAKVVHHLADAHPGSQPHQREVLPLGGVAGSGCEYLVVSCGRKGGQRDTFWQAQDTN